MPRSTVNKADLVAALTSADLVVTALRRFGLRRVQIADHDDVLGLALIQFDLPDGWRPQDKADDRHLFLAPRDELDRVLVHLRHDFASRYRGWVPAVGKNRVVGGVASANGQFGGGGAGKPRPATKPGTTLDNGQFGGGGAGEPTAVDVGKFAPARVSLNGYRPAAAHLGRHARVAVLDTVLATSPGLEGKVLAPAKTYLSGPGPHTYMEGHATFIHGLIAARAPSAQLRTTAVLTGPESTSDAWTVARAMAALAGSDVQILNMSMGCFTDDNRAPFVLRRAVEVLTPHIAIVAAAGNHLEPKDPQPYWPAALDSVVAVGAYDATKARHPMAAFSPRADWVDLEAPGVDVVSLYLTGKVTGADGALIDDFTGLASWEGTSAAAAIVSGAIAAKLRPGVSAAETVQRLRRASAGEVRPYRAH